MTLTRHSRNQTGSADDADDAERRNLKVGAALKCPPNRMNKGLNNSVEKYSATKSTNLTSEVLMRCGKALLLGTILSLAVFAIGCGSGGSSGGSPPPPTVSVTISPATASVPAGATQQFTAAVTGSSNTMVTWSVNGTTGGSAAGGTISTSGLYTAPNTAPSPSSVTVTATSQADTTKSASANVTITTPPLSLSSLSPIVAMQNGGAFTLTVNGTGFTPGSQLLFNGAAKPTAFVSPTQITAQISPSDISQPGTFPAKVQTGGMAGNSANFFVVPSITMQDVSVTAGAESGGVNVGVPALNPRLLLEAVGIGNSAGGTGVELKQGRPANLFLVGKGIVAGTFYVITGNPGDVTVTQPLAADFAQTTDGIPAVNVKISLSPSAALGPRNILVINPAGEISVFVGGLLITSES